MSEQECSSGKCRTECPRLPHDTAVFLTQTLCPVCKFGGGTICEEIPEAVLTDAVQLCGFDPTRRGFIYKASSPLGDLVNESVNYRRLSEAKNIMWSFVLVKKNEGE
jgi:hypothetical protein